MIDIRKLYQTLNTAKRDALLVGISVTLVYTIVLQINLAETLAEHFKKYEHLQLDETPFLLLLIALGLSWFTHRRICERNQEISRRINAEKKMIQLLTENQSLAQHILNVQETERLALARDLHDDIGQYLLAIRLDASALNLNAKDENSANNLHARRILSNADHIQKMTKKLMKRLRPAPIDSKDLFDAIDQLIEEWHQHLPHIHLERSIDKHSMYFTEQINVTIYRFIQEALTNVSKYAEARHVKVTLSLNNKPNPPFVYVEVKDDGKGYSIDTPLGMGMIGMRERISAVMGEFLASSGVNQGVTISAKIPLKPTLRNTLPN